MDGGPATGCGADGTGLAKAIDYTRKRWVALTRYLDDGRYPFDTTILSRMRSGRSRWVERIGYSPVPNLQVNAPLRADFGDRDRLFR